MSKFNVPSKHEVKSYEGGTVYNKKFEDEWQNILFSWFVQPSFYRTEDETFNRFVFLTKSIIESKGAQTVTNMAVYSRNILGMRSVSCVVAALLNNVQFDTKRQFYRNFFHRPDDVAEVFSLLEKFEEKPSHALVRGACGYLNSLDDYQVSKYRMEGKNYSMMDLVNLTHAKSDSISKLKKNTLPLAKTWENEVFKAKDNADKQEHWLDLLSSNKLGVMAIVRNLRNMIKTGAVVESNIHDLIGMKITDTKAVKKSLMFPFRAYTAYKALNQDLEYQPAYEMPMLLANTYLKRMFMLSFDNVEKIKGTTAVIMDVSGSMACPSLTSLTPAEIGMLFATSMNSVCESCDVVAFATKSKKVKVPTQPDRIFDLVENFHDLTAQLGYGTEIVPAIELLDKHYDRVVIVSDMQIMDNNPWFCQHGTNPAKQAIDKYKKKFGNCSVYSFDLGNYSTQILKQEDDVCYISCMNDSVFKFINLHELNVSLFDYVNNWMENNNG